MPELRHVGLDNPVFEGRLRQPTRGSLPPVAVRHITRPATRYFSDIRQPTPAKQKLFVTTPQPQKPKPIVAAPPQPITLPQIIHAQPFVTPKRHLPQRSQVLHRQVVNHPAANLHKLAKRQPRSKSQIGMLAMAAIIFIVGLSVSFLTLQTNHTAESQVAALAEETNTATTTGSGTTSDAAVPSTAKISAASIASYAVAPDLPRYLNIPKLGVHARVLSLGILSSGALGTPSNVFDTGWYDGSAKPGDPASDGATLIDGHVSSWTTHGVFYGINTLSAGDSLQIVRGDGTVFNYQVVKTQIFNSNAVDMQSAIEPVTAGKPGLNLITCTGQVKPGTSEFNERVIVYATQI